MLRSVVSVLGLCLILIHQSTQQLNIKVEIKGDADNITLEDNTLSAELSQANLTQGYIQSISQAELMVNICPTGTYSLPNTGECIDCPAGTASPVEGAANDMTCAACGAGTFAKAAASVCTNCPVHTFSTLYKASSKSQCIACPTNTTSAVGSGNVRACVCNSGFFVSNNLVSAFDGVIDTLGFDGAISIDLPHVAC